ncbi:MAG: UDP-3-O-acyl-N-acetylglucosamine deacetylase [Fibrobacterota bacterium]|nr:UDP-3-O-acyl-N-acetylglucosamine deacetylase [Fibrobacterota bacterium]
MEKKHPQILTGPGLHGGTPARLEIAIREPQGAQGAPEAPGPRLRFPGTGWVSRAELASLPRLADRSTRLGSPGSEIRTPEHLLAALLFFRESPLDIDCDAPEPPGLDGSALAYREALARLNPAGAAAPAWRHYSSGLDWEYHWSYGSLRVRPASGFRVRYELDRAPLRQVFVLEDPETAWREILPARTFAFHGEWREAVARGLMTGAGPDSGMLLAESESGHRELLRAHPEWKGGPFPLLNQPEWRMENELAKHKILDLLGDLALADLALPAVEIDIRNGGHRINHMLVDKLLTVRY